MNIIVNEVRMTTTIWRNSTRTKENWDLMMRWSINHAICDEKSF